MHAVAGRVVLEEHVAHLEPLAEPGQARGDVRAVGLGRGEAERPLQHVGPRGEAALHELRGEQAVLRRLAGV